MEQNKEGLIIAIIPARGGSKGVPKKNIKLLEGKPLIAYSIEAAKNSGVVDKVFVSTDDEEIAEVSKKYGAEIVYEKEENKDQFDLTKESYLQYAIEEIEKLGIKIKLIVFLQATSPLRNSEKVKEAIKKIYEEGYDSALSVYPTYAYFGEVKEGQYIPFRKVRQRKQEMVPWYCDNGALYVIKRPVFDRVRNRYGGKIGVVMMTEEDSLQIDYPSEWWLANQIIKRKKSKDNFD